MIGLERFTPEYDRIHGRFLGFPPIAIEYFLLEHDDAWLQLNAIYNYQGIIFGGCIHDQQAIAEWCWEHIDLEPSPLLVEYKKREWWICPYGKCEVMERSRKHGQEFN